MSALSIRNMNWTIGQRELMEETPKRTIIEELTSTIRMRNILKKNELSWSRVKRDTACIFCKAAIRFHREEKDALEQLTVLASITK